MTERETPDCHIFCDGASPLSWTLLPSLLEASRGKLHVTHIWDVSLGGLGRSPLASLRRRVYRTLCPEPAWLTRGWKGRFEIPEGPWTSQACADINAMVQPVVEAGDQLSDLAILLGCPQILDPSTLNGFGRVINYHNSFLPNYRGLNATAWALVDRQERCGFTFHEVDGGLDTGPIIYQEQLALDSSLGAEENEVRITLKAAGKMDQLVSMLLEGKAGDPQIAKGKLYTQKMMESLLTMNPNRSVEESKRLLGIWGHLLTNDRGTWVKVTSIDEEGRITGMDHLPVALHRLVRPLMGRRKP